ncbi:MAG TPA: ComEC/Rec2 family competence protein [Actinomycetota bacterium]|nr:ComEC/Rec2 family competence protein [Actinomycetota bacterium]
MALAAATATGVLLGARFAVAAAWVVAATCLAMACLGAGTVWRLRDDGGSSAVVGVLVVGTLLASGGAAAAVRATAVRGGVLPGWVGQPARVEVTGAVAEEPRRLRYGGLWVVLTVDQLQRDGRTYRTRERAGMIVPRGRFPPPRAPTAVAGRVEGGRPVPPGPASTPDRGAVEERLAVGDRLRVRASVGAARWSDPLGRQPPVVLRNPIIQERAPPAGAALRVSERVRDAARRRALERLAPERAGLLVGMALGDTSLLPQELERDFRAAGLTHLMAVSGANLAVVLAAGLWLAGVGGAGRRALAVVGIVLVVMLVVVTRWEPSVLRAGVMAGLVLLGVASGRGPGGRRALCLAVVVLLLADPGLAGALGFQLSVAATAGVLWLGPAAARALPERIPERIRKGVGMTLGAQATAMPVLALVFGSVSLAGLPANLLGLPLAGGPMLLGVVAAATAPVAPWVANLACGLADPFLIALVAVARWAAGLPGGSVTLAGPARVVPAAVVGLGLLAVVRRRSPPYLPRFAKPPTGIEGTVQGRDGQRRRAPPGDAVTTGGRGAGDLGSPDLPGPGQDVRHHVR